MKLVVVEDFPPVARQVVRFLQEILEHEPGQIEVFESLPVALKHLAAHPADAVLLDLNFKGQDGFELLTQAVAQPFHTIVVSGNTDRALEAFEYGVLDFVPKPLEKVRLQKAIARLQGSPAANGNPPTNFLVVRSSGQLRKIPLDKIRFIRDAGKSAVLMLHDGQTLLHDKSLEKLELLLPGHLRIHKSYLAPIKAIQKLMVHGGGKYEVALNSGDILPVGQSRIDALRKRFTEEK